MRVATITKLVASVSIIGRQATSFTPHYGIIPRSMAMLKSRLMMSSSDGIEVKHIGWEGMDEIIDEYESNGREESGMVVIDVRNEDEIAYTGKLSPNTLTLPLPVIMAKTVFDMDPEEFEELCGFAKPTPDETIVFSCAAGIRSMHAISFAKQSGYSKLVNYAGGANEWFTRQM